MQMSSYILLIKYHNADKLTFNDQIQRMRIVLDNASIHKTAAVKEFAESTKLHILTIPPYSPSLNGAEVLIQAIKAKINQKRSKCK